MAQLRVETFDRVATVTLDRAPVNALTSALLENLAEVFETFATSLDVNAVILTGSGTRAFCAGLDLHESFPPTIEANATRKRAYSAVRHCEVPVIAAVNGPALGAGAVLAAVCDIRIAAETATFGLPEINVGRCGGAAHLGRLIPQGALRRMAFSGEPMPVVEAWRVGLVDEVVGRERLMPAARSLARALAAKAPLGLRCTKRALNETEKMQVEDGYALEQDYNAKLMQTADATEAWRAMVEKRRPVFRGE
jgi:enoyl-CoA hydratase